MKSTLIIKDHLSSFDYVIFFSILVLTFLFVFYGLRRKKRDLNQTESYLDLLLMGRSLTLPMFIATLVATWYGGIFGVAQIAFEQGIFNFVTQGVFWYITYLIFALIILPKIKNYNALTLPDLIGKLFGPKSKKVAALFNILNLVPVAYTISIGLLVQMLFGYELNTGIILGVSCVLAYSFFGGMRSVVYSDIFQFFIMVSSVLLVFIISIYDYGLAPLKNLPETYFNPLGTYSIKEAVVWGLIALSTLVDPNFYQRCFAAKDFNIAKKGIIYSTIIWMIFDLSLTFGAMYAKSIIPQAASHEGYFIYALQILPQGLRGFFIAGITATVLSTLDSYIFLAGSTLSLDLLPAKLKNKTIQHRIGIILVALISIIMAMVFEGDIKDVWKALGSISSSALLAPVLFGYFYKKHATDLVFLLASTLGAIATIYWRLSGLKQVYALDEIYIGVAASILGILISLIIKNKKVAITPFYFQAKV